MYNKIIDEINNADMVLVGLGNEIACDYKINTAEHISRKTWIDYKNVAEKTCKERAIRFYNELETILHNKNYFVITTNFDGFVSKSNLNPIRVVAPCGDINRMQCMCQGLDGIMHEDVNFYVEDAICVCPKCNSEYVPNVYNKTYYNEEGYLKQWNLYNKWLQGTLNKKLVVLEMGCDFSMLSIIRLPFERIVLINQKAQYYRISDRFPQVTAELKDRMESVKKNPFDFVRECCSIE